MKELSDKDFATKVRKYGRHFPKKHGHWFRAPTHIDNMYLVLDTWNGQVYLHEGATPSDTDNMYRVVYIFSGMVDRIHGYMKNFWAAHIIIQGPFIMGGVGTGTWQQMPEEFKKQIYNTPPFNL